MTITKRKQLINAYIDFFKSKNHKEIPNSSLIPENDPTVLFTTAGMHPLVPFLLGQKHPLGKRLVNVQKCIRTGDIDSVGNDFHLTFFEMLGNWSLGDYFKKQAIEYSFEFLTSPKYLNIPKEKISITCFAGDKDAPKDEESASVWQSLDIQKSKIKFLGKEDNWWGPAGKTGPCGPDTEMFVNGFEIWNDVFMQYNKDEKGNYQELKQKNVDTGMGVERTLAILNNKSSVYETECFLPIIKEIEKLSKKKYGKDKGETRAMRIIADHIKASVFILAEGIVPSNTEQGYVLRRLIRRAVRYGKELGINSVINIAEPVFEIYKDYNLDKKFIKQELENEQSRFLKTLEQGIKVAEKITKEKTPIDSKKFSELMKDPNKADLIGRIFDKKREGRTYSLKNPEISEKEVDSAEITGKEAFLLFQSYGFPLEMIDEIAMAKCLLLSHRDFRKELAKHQELSRTATVGRFKSGLADKSEATTKLHTAAHMLLAALRKVLKQDIHQKGSNITAERLRFDFNFPRKLTEQEIKKVESTVNEQIKKSLPVKHEELTLEQAKKSGAEGVFDDKYKNLEKVFVYSIGEKGKEFSKEICAGPHISNTKELGNFKIIKEESSSAGVRRIKAILE